MLISITRVEPSPFRNQDKEFVYRCCRSSPFVMIVSTSGVRKLIIGGCVAYSDIVVDEHVESSAYEDIPVARDYPDVFPKELP